MCKCKCGPALLSMNNLCIESMELDAFSSGILVQPSKSSGKSAIKMLTRCHSMIWQAIDGRVDDVYTRIGPKMLA